MVLVVLVVVPITTVLVVVLAGRLGDVPQYSVAPCVFSLRLDCITPKTFSMCCCQSRSEKWASLTGTPFHLRPVGVVWLEYPTYCLGWEGNSYRVRFVTQ